MKQKSMIGVRGYRTTVLSLALLGLFGANAAEASPSAPGKGADPKAAFAQVAGTVITHEEFNAAFSAAARNKFFHGKAGGEDVALLQREVADQLVTRVLLLRAARSRDMKADAAAIQKEIDTYEQRYASSEHWKKNREQLIPGLKARLEEQSLLSQIEKAMRVAAKPEESAVRAYYAKHPEKFTEPEQLHVSVILLKVDPSSPATIWEKTQQEAVAIAKRLRTGTDFAVLARQYSGDAPSREKGGDMGYVHTGMLPEEAQQALNAVKPGELTAPVKVLQGFAIFRLVDRKQPKLAGFDTVKSRAEELLKREQSEAAWQEFVARLKSKSPAQMDQSQFLPMSERTNARAAPAK